MLRKSLPALACVITACSLAAQAPSYDVSPAVRPGQSIDSLLAGRPGAPFVSWIDVDGGPLDLLGETLYLGLTPGLSVYDVGAIPAGGLRFLQVGTPAGGLPLGVPLYLQSLVLDASAPNGLFRASDGESTTFYGSSGVIVENFRAPGFEGITGSFDGSVRGRLQGAPVQRRVHTVSVPEATPFALPVKGPLDPSGARVQMVYRAVDLGATGTPEVIVSIRWRPQGQLVDDSFQRLAIDAVHSQVVPDYTINPFTALPMFPSSGLATTFALNPKAGDTPVRIYDGPYSIRTQSQQPDGYVPYPQPAQFFRYNGVDSLLLDFRMAISPASSGANGQSVSLGVTTSPRPNARARASGVDPFGATVATSADNTISDAQLELARIESQAVSPWRAASVAAPNYGQPVVAASVPNGASLVIEYRGALSATGAQATFWSTIVDVADGRPFLQWRATFHGDPITGAVPSIDAIVIPVN